MAYKDCLDEMGNNAYKGYSTSSDDEDSEDHGANAKNKIEDEDELERKNVKDEELDEEARN